MDATGKGIGTGSEGPQARGSSVRKWLRRLAACGVLLLVCAVLGAGYFYFKFSAVRSSEPYRMALAQVQEDPFVVEQLGEPIRDVTWFPGGVFEEKRGSASLHFQVAGPKGQAQVGLQARRIQGTWGLVLIDVTLPDGTRRSLDTGDAGGGEAPKWSPGQ